MTGEFLVTACLCIANAVLRVTHDFTSNGLKHANKLLGYQAFRSDEWEAIGEYDEQGGRHRAFVVPTKDITVEGVPLKQGEKVRIEESYKFSALQAEELWRKAHVIPLCAYSNRANDYGKIPYISSSI